MADVFNWLRKAFDWTTGKIDQVTASWVNTVVRGIWTFLTSLFRGVIDAWNDFYKASQALGHGLALLASSTWHWVTWFLDVFWRQWLKWVEDHIIKPLLVAWHWVIHEGAIVWHYLTHAADLVAFFWDALIAKLEHESWTVAEKLGDFFLALVVKNLRRFAELVEDILDAVF